MKNKVQVPPPAARRSLNEVEALGKRAARGAGLPFGIAEEAGKAARWLSARGLPGAEQLADLLTRHDRRPYAELAPVDVSGIWQASSGQLCPLIAGAALSDLAAEIAEGRVIELGVTAQPLLLAPYAAATAKLTGVALALAWKDVDMHLTPDGVAIQGNHNALTTETARTVRCHCTNDLAAPVNEPVVPAVASVTVDDAAWRRLAAFAHRTLAPATEASRLSGAGAGPGDNN